MFAIIFPIQTTKFNFSSTIVAEAYFATFFILLFACMITIQASCTINYRCNYTNSASNGATALTFDSFDAGEDGEHNGVGSVEIP